MLSYKLNFSSCVIRMDSANPVAYNAYAVPYSWYIFGGQ